MDEKGRKIMQFSRTPNAGLAKWEWNCEGSSDVLLRVHNSRTDVAVTSHFSQIESIQFL